MKKEIMKNDWITLSLTIFAQIYNPIEWATVTIISSGLVIKKSTCTGLLPYSGTLIKFEYPSYAWIIPLVF